MMARLARSHGVEYVIPQRAAAQLSYYFQLELEELPVLERDVPDWEEWEWEVPWSRSHQWPLVTQYYNYSALGKFQKFRNQ